VERDQPRVPVVARVVALDMLDSMMILAVGPIASVRQGDPRQRERCSGYCCGHHPSHLSSLLRPKFDGRLIVVWP
jgi:hypothetical protein